ncbi:MAG: CDP-alcohol phosphatidyltransferase family protein [Gammaproteobacteria bacterium]
MSKQTSAPNSTAPVPPPRTHTHAIARWLIRPLVHTAVTPNQLTTLRLLSGIAAAAAFATGTPSGNLWGGLLFVLSTLLDRADGELARLSGRCSPGGHRYDLSCDLASNAIVFLGIGIGVSHGELGSIAIFMGAVAGLSIAAIFLIVFGLHNHGSNPQEAFGAASRFDLDDGLFLLAPLAWWGYLQPLLVAAAIGAPCFLAYAMLRYRSMQTRSATRRDF